MNINNYFIDNDKVKIPNSECPADILNVQSQLNLASERIKILSAQIAMERLEIQTPEQIAECAAARITQTTELDDFMSKKTTIDPTAPVKKYDFVAAAKFCEAEYNRLQRKMRRKPFKIPKYRKEVKPPVPPRPVPPKPEQPQRYSDDDVIEMVLKPGSGVNGPPIYTPAISQSPYCMKRPPRFWTYQAGLQSLSAGSFSICGPANNIVD